jgi:nucleoid DNA-binding protein
MAKKAAPKAAEPKPAPTPVPAPAKKAEKAAAPKPKPATKSEIFAALAEKTKLTKKQVSEVFEAMSELIAKDLGKKGPGIFVVPGLLKLKIVDKPATKAKQSINPFTKEPMMTKAKPARKAVKAVLLKSLKELV